MLADPMLVGNKVITKEQIVHLITDIKKKKELREISDEFVKNQLFSFLQKERKLAHSLEESFNCKSFAYKLVVKKIRHQLRLVYGLFRIDEEIKKRKLLMKELLGVNSKKDVYSKTNNKIIENILATHSSTRERTHFYRQLYQQIFAITGHPQAVIDIGCGINPFSYPYMGLKKLNYYAYDISNEEVGILNQFFAYLHSNNRLFWGTAEILDALHGKELGKLKPVDICFLFKMTDMLDKGIGHKVTEQVVKNIPTRFVVVSFPTLTISGKRMNFPGRKWFELMCSRRGYKFSKLVFSNEVFYVVETGSVEKVRLCHYWEL